MNSTVIFWPMIAQAFLAYAIYVLVSRRRVVAIKTGLAKSSDYRIPITEPEPSATAIRSLINQFELPVLFFAACLALQAVDGVSFLALIVAWVFVASRFLHAYVHVTTNRLRHRRPLFVVGFLASMALWVLLAAHLLGVAR